MGRSQSAVVWCRERWRLKVNIFYKWATCSLLLERPHFFNFLEFSHCQKLFFIFIKGLSAPHSNRLLMHTWSTEIIQKYFHHEVYFEDFVLGVQACVCVHVKHGPFDGFIIYFQWFRYSL